MLPSDILGVVLAGGAGSRLGRDKASLRWPGPASGATLTQRAAAVLGRVCGQVVVAGPPVLARRGLETIADHYPHRGPLAGVHAGLVRAAGRAVFVLACDLPLVSVELVGHLAGAGRGRRHGAWVAADATGAQPLCGLYAHGCLPVAARRLAAGQLAMHGFLAAVGGVEVPVTPELACYRPGLLLNINRPGDLERARRVAAGAPA